MASKNRPPRLGRGLSSLLAQPAPVPITPPAQPAAKAAARPAGARSTSPRPQPSAPPAASTAPPASADADAGPPLVFLRLADLQPNPHQPRQLFEPQALERLADSIRRDGMMQPIIVRPLATPTPAGVHYEIVAGERRWRAAERAGLKEVPALVRPLTDQQVAEWALIENLQREDLNPLERAEAFRRLIDRFQLSHEQIAERVGVDRSTITNTLRLLTLHPDLQRLVRDGRLSAGQARALASVPDLQQQLALAKRAIAQEWSVRRIEGEVRSLADAEGAPAPTPPAKVRSAHLADLEQQIAQQLQTRVRIKAGRKKGSGSLTIDFHSIDQFDSLLGKLGVQTE